jgi:hypothetical protein
LPQETDKKAFEEFVKGEIFNNVKITPTRAGQVNGQYLAKSRSQKYSYIVEWVEIGGSPFGADGAPIDLTNELVAFNVTTFFTRYTVVADKKLQNR